MILDTKANRTLRPMKYPQFYEMYKTGIKNNWTVDEVNFSSDIPDLKFKMTEGERHLVNRLVAFFATGDTIVNENVVLHLFKHINSPEARMMLSRICFEEALHIQFYLTLLDTYLPNEKDRNEAFAAIDNIPSIKKKAEFCFKWMDDVAKIKSLESVEDKRKFILNLTTFACAVEGLFFFGAFAYIFFLRSKNLLPGLAQGTAMTLRDETCVHPLTEVLTPNGWTMFPNLKETDQVMQFDMKTQEFSFVIPNKIIKKKYDGDMYHFYGDKFDQLVTEDHDMLWKYSKDKEFKKIKAKNIIPHDDIEYPILNDDKYQSVKASTISKEVYHYFGDVYCVNVPTGAFVIRSNGKVSVTGNCHINFALETLSVIKSEEPNLFDNKYESEVVQMLEEAIDCEMSFCEDVLSLGIAGLSANDMREYLQYIADQRLIALGFSKKFGSKNPFLFLELQNIQELTNFFERRVTAYAVATEGSISFDEDF